MLAATIRTLLTALLLAQPPAAQASSLVSLPDGVRVQGIHFETDQPTFLPDSVPVLDALAIFLRDPRHATRRYEVSVQFPYSAACGMLPSRHVEELNLSRARLVRAVLIERGIDPAKLTARLYVLRHSVQEIRSGRSARGRRVELHEIGPDDRPLRWRPRSSAGVLAL